MKNLDNIIATHNGNILRNHVEVQPDTTTTCSCRVKYSCPLEGNCNVENVIYQAEIHPSNKPLENRIYIGMAKGKWKLRYAVHKHSMKVKNSDNKTALSEHFWTLHDNGKNPVVKWSILVQTRPPEHINDRCLLCASEKIKILRFRNREKLLNKRNELISTCPHKRNLTVLKVNTSNSTWAIYAVNYKLRRYKMNAYQSYGIDVTNLFVAFW